MSAASDKARFHIEQTVIDLREWERRELFSTSELTTITSKRTSFETQLNSREATPALYIRYIAHETNISALLSKRLTRYSISAKSAQKLRISQQRRLFNILDRATRRFHGDLDLWAQYLHFCREQGAVRRGQRVLTECLRLFPKRPEVWGYAAGWAVGTGDLSAARGYYLRGLRFCSKQQNGSKDLYLRFARAEMRWVAERRRILGLKDDTDLGGKRLEGSVEQNHHEEKEQKDVDTIALVSNTADGDAINESFDHFSSTPAMTGAIPMAIFDQAMDAYDQDAALAEAFFDIFAQFAQLPCTERILNHVVGVLSNSSNVIVTQSCRCRLPLIGVPRDAPEFPAAIRACLSTLKSGFVALGDDEKKKTELSRGLLSWLRPLAEDDKLVSELKTILKATVKQLDRTTQTVIPTE